MSLAMSAAPYDNNEYTENNQSSIKQPKRHNKTQKRQALDKDIDTNKVNNVLQTIHNLPSGDDDNEMGDFNPPSPPVSSGVERTHDAKETPAMQYMKKEEEKRNARTSGNATNYMDESLEVNDYEKNYGSEMENQQYYKKFVPNYPNVQADVNPENRPYYNYPMSPQSQSVDSSVLLEKLNYMIHLLEEQKDERVGSVTEEVILYSFLGIFVIFLVDSFTRVGKYKR